MRKFRSVPGRLQRTPAALGGFAPRGSSTGFPGRYGKLRGRYTATRPRRWLASLATLTTALVLAPAAAGASTAPGSLTARELASAAHAPGDNFGYSVALSGTTAIIGAPGVQGSAGGAYLYARSGGSWHQQGAVTDPAHTSGDVFGYSVSVSGGTAVVGAWGTSKHAGAAYVYARSGQTWHLQATLTDPGTSSDLFGYSVAVSGQTLVVGSFSANEGAGAAYVYVRSGHTWQRQATLTGLPGSSVFGAAVAISGPTAVIGAWGTGNQAGAVDIFARSGSTWHRQVTLGNPAGFSQDHFGSAVAVSGSTAVIGAPTATAGDDGATYIYTRSAGHWHRGATLADPVGDPNDHFGWSVAVSGTRVPRVLSGAPSTGSACGAAYEYTHRHGHWRKRVTVVEPSCASQDNVGFGVALSGRLAVLGAPGKNSFAGSVITLRVP